MIRYVYTYFIVWKKMNSSHPQTQMYKELSEEICSFETSKEKFSFLVELSEDLPKIDDSYKIMEYLIPGCASSAWIHVEKKNDNLIFTADADAVISKGFLTFLILSLQDLSAEAIVSLPLEYFSSTGLVSSLSPSRANGFLASFQKLQKEVEKLLPNK